MLHSNLFAWRLVAVPLVVLVATSGTAFAHVRPQTTDPGSGARLDAPPAQDVQDRLRRHPARLIAFVGAGLRRGRHVQQRRQQGAVLLGTPQPRFRFRSERRGVLLYRLTGRAATGNVQRPVPFRFRLPEHRQAVR